MVVSAVSDRCRDLVLWFVRVVSFGELPGAFTDSFTDSTFSFSSLLKHANIVATRATMRCLAFLNITFLSITLFAMIKRDL